MATQDPTVNYGWDLPTVGGSTGAWGTALNTILGDDATGIDAVVKAVSDVANAAMPKAGGTFTGEVAFLTTTYTVSALGNVSGATPLDMDAANVFTATVTGDTTFSITNVPSGAVFLTLIITNGGAHTITWPASVDWPSGAAPTLTASGVDIITLLTVDGGVTWHAQQGSADSR